jgi:hypothetical protein
MSERRPLDVIQVNEPCHADWGTMIGDERSRFCEHCKKFVHDLGALSADEAERLICSAAGTMCVRFARDLKTNAVVTLDYAQRKDYSRKRAWFILAAIGTAVSSVAAWAGIRILTPAPPMPMVQGVIVCPAPPQDQSAVPGEAPLPGVPL